MQRKKSGDVMLKSVSVICAVLFSLAASLAHAESVDAQKKFTAQIVKAQGKVLLNQGAGYAAAPLKARLSVGDQLMVGSDSSAEIVYGANGCVLSINAGSLVTISEKAPCKKGESLAMAGQVMITPTFGVGAGENYSHLINIAPLLVVLGVVLVVASTYEEPEPASGP